MMLFLHAPSFSRGCIFILSKKGCGIDMKTATECDSDSHCCMYTKKVSHVRSLFSHKYIVT